MEGKQHIVGILGPVSIPVNLDTTHTISSEQEPLAVLGDHIFCNSSHLYSDKPKGKQAQAPTGERFTLQDVSTLKLRPWEKLGNLSLEWSVDEAETEVKEFVNHGGVLLCETSPRGRNRKPERLFELARRLHPRLHIVVGTGWSPQDSNFTSNVKAIEESFRAELENGFAFDEQSTLQYIQTHQKRTLPVGRAGLIGEIAVAANMLTSSGTRSEMVVKAARNVQADLGCPVLVNVSDGGVAHSLGLAAKVVEVFMEAQQDCSRLALSGITNNIPLILDNEKRKDIFRGVAGLLQQSRATLVVTHAQDIVQGSNDLATVVALVKYLVNEGLADQLVIGQNTRFKSHLRRFGGFGYIYAQEVLCSLLRDQSVQLDKGDLKKIMTENLRKFLSFWEPPAKPKPLPETFWHCDYCNKKMRASIEPFTYLEYRYCSMKCLKKHKEEINSGKNPPSDGGGGPRQKGSNGTSWGIAVGSA